MRTGRLGRSARMTAREMKTVFSSGRKCVRPDLILWYRRASGTAEGPRMGLSVSRKVGGSVRRSRLKRLIRESFRFNRSRIAPGADCIFYPRPGCRWKGLSDAEEALVDVCRRAGILRHE